MVVSSGRHRGKAVLLPPKVVVIGRSRECHVRLASRLVSGKHCALAPHGRTLSVCDLGSRHGTYVNGGRIDRQTRVKHGDALQVGPVSFRVCVPRAPSWKEPLDRQRQEIAWLWEETDAALWDALERVEGAGLEGAIGPASGDGSASLEPSGDEIAIAAGHLWNSGLGNGRNGSD